jgi:hypothetical protein
MAGGDQAAEPAATVTPRAKELEVNPIPTATSHSTQVAFAIEGVNSRFWL